MSVQQLDLLSAPAAGSAPPRTEHRPTRSGWPSPSAASSPRATPRPPASVTELDLQHLATELDLQHLATELDLQHLATLRRMAQASESRGGGEVQHTERVGLTSLAIAVELGLPASEQTLIYHAAPLHDIGKLGVPTAILSKPGPLTLTEFEQVKRHTLIGGMLLCGGRLEVVRLAREIALTHHEWWDGSGYPAGLRGDAIPVAGRIVALADVFDALTHSRPYKAAWPLEDAVEEIVALGGRQFDPDVVEAFLRSIDACAAATRAIGSRNGEQLT